MLPLSCSGVACDVRWSLPSRSCQGLPAASTPASLHAQALVAMPTGTEPSAGDMTMESLKLPSHVRTTQRAPQNDIPANPAVKVFVAHGGTNSAL